MKSLRFILPFLTLLIASSPLFAQQDTLVLGVDELFSVARMRAFEGRHEDARVLLRKILKRSPDYSDVRILLGRTLAWDGKYDSARAEFGVVLKADARNRDALLALVDVELWSDRFQDAVSLCDQGLKLRPNDDELGIKKARALRNLGNDKEALAVLGRAEDANPSNPDIAPLRDQIRLMSLYYSVSANYTYDYFSEIYDPMHLGYVQVSRRTSLGSVFGRLNYGYRFKSPGIQGEVDFYPRIKSGIYAYVNYGYSGDDIFPKHRFGAEVYGRLPSSMEGSVGLRYLYFGPNSHVTIYTGSLGIYEGNFYFVLRPYITPNNSSFSRSLSFLVRKYNGDADNYFSFKGSVGFTPDERTIVLSTGENGKETYFLKSQNIGVGCQVALQTTLLLTATYDLTHQELIFSRGEYVYDHSVSIGLKSIL